MTQYIALTYTRDVDWSAPEQAEDMIEYKRFGDEHAAQIRGGDVLYPTSTATTVRVTGARGGDVVTTDGPYAETKEALTGFYLIEAEDLDEAIRIAAELPAAWDGAVELRPVIRLWADRELVNAAGPARRGDPGRGCAPAGHPRPDPSATGRWRRRRCRRRRSPRSATGPPTGCPTIRGPG